MTDSEDLNKKVRTVLITGASGGIGREIAIRFAKEGWNTVCHYNRSKQKAEQLKEIIDSLGGICHLIKGDFSSQTEFQSFIDTVKSFDIDSIINCAGTYVLSRTLSELDIDFLTVAFAINTFAPMLSAAHFFESMKEKSFGRIVNISSIAAKYGGSLCSMHYGCSKRALEGITRTLAREGAKNNVLVNTVRLGVIDTEFHNTFPKDMKKRIGMIPVQRIGKPTEVVDIIYYLGSDKNTFITNETIAVAGGE